MDDQLDDDLKKRISEVFDNYDDSSADEGWLLLREKFPAEQSRRRAFAWVWWGAAALLLMFLGAGLWIYNNKTEQQQKFSLKMTRRINPANQIVALPRPATVHPAIPGKKEHLAQSLAGNAQSLLKSRPLKTVNTPMPYLQPALAVNLPVKDNAIKNHGIIKNPVAAPQLKLKDTAINNDIIAKNLAGNTTNVADVTLSQQLAATPVVSPIKPVQSVVKVKPSVKTIDDMFAADNKVRKPDKNLDEEKDYTKRVNFGVYATTYFNYAKGSNNQVNAGAGFSSDIRISKNLKLVTGVAVGQNTLSYAGTEQPAAVQQNIAITASYAAVKTAAATPLIARGYQNVADIAAPTFANYNASLIGLDIPVNLKYEFNPQKNDIYISAGFSSGTFINESYTYLYNYPSFNSTDAQTKNETTSKSFNSFYFAKTVNFAFGMGYPFGKNRLVIEPFLKYPLDGLGSQQLKFGAGGLNLKFNFAGAKK